MLKIYYLSTEIAPFSSTYSLSTFTKELSTILNNDKNIDIRLAQPKYGYISDRRYILREVIRLKDMEIEFFGKVHKINIKSGFIPNTRVQVYFMEHKDFFFSVPELIYKSRNGRIYANNIEKFSFFSIGAIETLQKLFWIPDILICNDWQLSLLPYLFKDRYKDIFNKMKIIFINHSFNKNYSCNKDFMKKINIDSKNNNLFINAVKYSDLSYMLDDKSTFKEITKNKSMKKCLDENIHKTYSYNSTMDPSERIEIYNLIAKDLLKL